MHETVVRDLTLEYLNNTEIGENLTKALNSLQNAQETAYAYVTDGSPEQLKQLRIGTVLVFAIIKKLGQGKSVKDFTHEDWSEIAADISDNAICIEPRLYSVRVFEAYADYVSVSVKTLRAKGVSENKCAAITAIENNVRELSDRFREGGISEVDYTEQCLWLLLEAMIKLLSSYTGIFIGDAGSDLVQSMVIYAFEYGRLSLYREEQELLTQYLEHQYEVDDELKEKLSDFQQKLQERQDEFNSLIADAFDDDISVRLRSSAQIALNVGVDESEVLDTIEKIDDFFM